MGTLRISMSNVGRRFELEGGEETVLSHLADMRQWLSEGVAASASERANPSESAEPAVAERATLRGFLGTKRPANSYEVMAVLLSYKKTHEGKDELSQDEIRTSMIQAGVRPPGVLGQALADCRRRYGYIESGSQRGFWRLSHQGETLVEIDLPRNA